MKFCKRTIFFDYYENLPDDAKYVVRQLSDYSVRLEMYLENNFGQIVIKDFPIGAFNEYSFYDTLKECRKIIHNSNLYVEKPYFMYNDDEPEDYSSESEEFDNF